MGRTASLSQLFNSPTQLKCSHRQYINRHGCVPIKYNSRLDLAHWQKFADLSFKIFTPLSKFFSHTLSYQFQSKLSIWDSISYTAWTPATSPVLSTITRKYVISILKKLDYYFSTFPTSSPCSYSSPDTVLDFLLQQDKKELWPVSVFNGFQDLLSLDYL